MEGSYNYCALILTRSTRATTVNGANLVNFVAVYNSVKNNIYFFRVPGKSTEFIGVARGCTGCTCTPRAEKKIWGQIYRGKL